MPDAIVEQPQALILQTEQLSRRFGETVAVGDISFAVRYGPVGVFRVARVLVGLGTVLFWLEAARWWKTNQ